MSNTIRAGGNDKIYKFLRDGNLVLSSIFHNISYVALQTLETESMRAK